MPKKKPDPAAHVVCDRETNGFACRHCGAKWIPDLPMPSGVFLRKLKAFQEFHTDCPPPPPLSENPPRLFLPTESGKGVI
jgi:hypothetical protein